MVVEKGDQAGSTLVRDIMEHLLECYPISEPGLRGVAGAEGGLEGEGRAEGKHGRWAVGGQDQGSNGDHKSHDCIVVAPVAPPTGQEPPTAQEEAQDSACPLRVTEHWFRFAQRVGNSSPPPQPAFRYHRTRPTIP